MYTQQNNTQEQFRKSDKCGQSGKGGFGRKFGEQFMRENHPLKEMFAKKMGSHKRANIREDDNNFIIELYAAGLDKTLFNVTVKDQVLTVSYKNSEENQNQKFLYQEVYHSSFERSFQLTDKVLADHPSAAYENGVLKITLPKNPEKNKPAQNVDVN